LYSKDLITVGRGFGHVPGRMLLRENQMFYSLARSIVFIICAVGVVSAQQSTGLWLDVPFVKQVKNGCGSASIAMVMQYWHLQQGRTLNDSSDAAKIHEALYVPGSDGIYASAMERYFQEHEFRTFPFRGDWEILQQHLQKGRPLIAALKPSGSDSTLHYVVVVGLDPEQDHILLNDPAQRKLLKHGRSDFEEQWSATGAWTLLALPQLSDSE
jgi:ABC-type bacteriocin/lantibiotic exporter with double-glycine peptidase domain